MQQMSVESAATAKSDVAAACCAGLAATVTGSQKAFAPAPCVTLMGMLAFIKEVMILL
jgi:hypothetical protein